MSNSSSSHRREKTESFGGSQLAFEFPNVSSSDMNEVRTNNYTATFSEISSNPSNVNNNFKYLTRISVSSSDGGTLNTSELFRTAEGDEFHDAKSSLSNSAYSSSKMSVRVKDTKQSKANSTISIQYSPSHKTLDQFVSRSSSMRKFRTSPSMRSQLTLKNADRGSAISKQSTLRRSNAIKHKEGWLSRLAKKCAKFTLRVKRWRNIMRRKAFKRRNGLKKSNDKRPQIALKRSNTMLKSFQTTYDLHERDLYSIPTATAQVQRENNLTRYLTKEQSLVDLSNLSKEILSENPATLESVSEQEEIAQQKAIDTAHMPIEEHTTAYPTPNLDTAYYDRLYPRDSTGAEFDKALINRMWAHYLKKTVASRIQLKLEISDFKDSRNEFIEQETPTIEQEEFASWKKESVLETIISDYEDEDDEDDDDGFEVETITGSHSSATSISSYDDEYDNELINELAISTNSRTPSIVSSAYQSSYYPTRQNSVIDRSASVKRANSFKVSRALSVHSDATSNLVYIEDFVNVKGSSSPQKERIVTAPNPYVRGGLTRSPSFILPKRANTLLSVREEV